MCYVLFFKILDDVLDKDNYIVVIKKSFRGFFSSVSVWYI